MKSQVLNTELSSGHMSHYPRLNDTQKRNLVAGLFEQLMLFDRAVVRTNGANHGLIFLIDALGLETVEKLLDKGCIDLLIWTPVIVTGGGMRLEDGSIDESVIYTQPPIVAGSMSDDDMDPENNIMKALNVFGVPRDKSRSFIRKARKRYVIPNGMEFSTGSSDLVLSAYENNDLSSLGLSFEKPPMDLNIEERQKLLGLSSKVLETALLSEYGYKSYENFEHFQLGRQALNKIGRAYQITENAESLFKLEKIPNLKSLFIEDRFEFDSVFSLRHTKNAKYFRNWLNDIDRSINAIDITTEYLNQLKGKHRVTATEDKLIKTISTVAVGAGLGAVLQAPEALVATTGLSLLDNFWLDNLIKGKNPSMFIEEIRGKLD